MSQSDSHPDARTNGIDSDCEQKPQKRQVKHDSGAADLEKVTDYAEDSEISSQNIAQVRLVSASHPISDHRSLLMHYRRST